MKTQNETRDAQHQPERLVYEPPRLIKRRAVTRVTLFSGGNFGGGGPTGGTLVGTG